MLVFYDDRQQVDGMQGFSPSAGKPKLVLESWKSNHPVTIMPVTPLTEEQFCYAHDPEYVTGVLSCAIDNGFSNRSKDIAESLPWTSGSFVSAAVYAFENEICTFSPTSGFHHAEYEEGMGFCTFSGLTITAIILNEDYGAKKVGILDLDSHYGNGTDDTIKQTGYGNVIRHYTIGKYKVKKHNVGEWLENLPKLLDFLYSDCDIILYQAGVDSHEDDPHVDSGHFSDEQIYQRDKMVFEFSKERGIPVVSNLAGGYQEPVSKVIRLHDYLAQAYHDVYLKS